MTSLVKMIPVYSISFLFLFSITVQAQTQKMNAGGIAMQVSATDPLLNKAFCTVGEMPEFPGGTAKLAAFAQRKIKYPQTAIRDSVQGSVLVLFVIDKKGKPTEMKIEKSVRYDLDKVCLAMLAAMPKWKPGRVNGKPISTYESWKITFVLSN
jgi:protein TonB